MTETLFNSFNLVYLVVVSAVALGMVAMLHPRRNARTLTEDELAAIMPAMPEETEPTTPAAGIEAFPGWIFLAVILIGYPLGHSIVTQGFGASWTINAYNAVFLMGAMLLQRRPANLVRAFGNGARRRRASSCSSRSTPASSGSSTAPASATGWAPCSCRWRPPRPIR